MLSRTCLALSVFLIVLVFNSCEKKDCRIIASGQIRLINSPEELSDKDKHSAGPKILRASDGREAADQQAKRWSNSVALIYVSQRVGFVKKMGEAGPAVWCYIYKNTSEDSWLAVMVGSDGVIDAGVKKSSRDTLKKWPEIKDWKIDSSYFPRSGYKSYTLIAAEDGEGRWIEENRAAPFKPNVTYYSAVSGSKIPQWSIGDRPPLFD